MMAVPTTATWTNSACPTVPFARSDLTTLTRPDEHGLRVTGQRLEPDRAVLACKIAAEDPWCRRCGAQGVPRGSVVRQLAHQPSGWRLTILRLRVRRYRCEGCEHVSRQDMSAAAAPRSKRTRGALRAAAERCDTLICDEP